jgi:GAF domain-containing protein/HAMP domain-containing protein
MNTNALRSAMALLLAAALNGVIALRQAIQNTQWQARIEAGVVLVFVITIVFSIVLIHRRHTERGTILLLAGFLITLFVRNALTADMGLLYGLVALTVTSVIAFYTMPPERATRTAVAGLLVGVLLILFDLYVPAYRQSAPEAISKSLPVVAGVTSLIIIFVGVRYFRQMNLQTRLTALILIALVPLLVGITVFISSRAGIEIERQANGHIEDGNASLASNVSTWLELHYRTLHEMTLLPEVISMDAALQRPNLLAIAAAHPNLFLVHTTDLNGINIARNDEDELKDYHDRGWFLGAKAGAPITYEVLISRTTGAPALNMSRPIRDESGQIIGVASMVSELDEISQEVLAGAEGQMITYIVDTTNRVVAHPDPTYTEGEELKDLSTYPPVAALRQGQTGIFSFTDENGEIWRAYVSTLENGWGIIAQQPEAELLASVRNFQRVAYTLITVGTALMLILAWWVIRRMIRPIGLLTEAASAIAAGDLNRKAEVTSQDEIGVLATTFNTMTTQLRDLIGSLEQRVAERTKALNTSTEVSRRLSTILDQKQLVAEVVDQVQSAFNYYHAHIYLLDEDSGDLVMAGGTGDAGATMMALNHKVQKGRGLVGRAAETNAPVLVPDTSKDPNWLPNPLLPETKSEVAVPIAAGDKVLGVLDVQHNVIAGLQQEDVNSLQSIANQVAVAMQNIQSTEVVTKRATELQTVAAISTAAATISDVQKMLETVVHLIQRRFGLYHAHVFTYDEAAEILHIVACGYKEGDAHEGTHGTAAIPISQERSLVARAARTRQAVIVNNVQDEPGWLPNPLLPETASELAVPMIVGDQLLGVMDVQSEHLNAFTEEDASIQITLASQLATAMQNARSFAQTQRRAEHETAVNLIAQKIQSTTTVEAALQVTARELGHALGMKPTLVTLDPESLVGERKAN